MTDGQPMFEIGKDYEVTMVEEGEEGRLVYTVAAFEHPLLKLRNPNVGELVVNVMSPNFVSAKLWQQPEPSGLEVRVTRKNQ